MPECAACGGAGCDACGQVGEFRVTECPLRFVTPDVWEAIEMADLRRRGEPPNPGGSLDQTAIFNDACRAIWAEQDRYRARRRADMMEMS